MKIIIEVNFGAPFKIWKEDGKVGPNMSEMSAVECSTKKGVHNIIEELLPDYVHKQ